MTEIGQVTTYHILLPLGVGDEENQQVIDRHRLMVPAATEEAGYLLYPSTLECT